MENRIYKYVIDLGKRSQRIDISSSEILSVQMQHGVCQLWAMVNINSDTRGVTIEVYATGEEVAGTEKLKFLATVQAADGHLVFHIFERIR